MERITTFLKQRTEKGAMEVTFSVVVLLYILSTQIMSAMFWWQMIKVDGFFKGFFLDPFLAELKGFLWPFFLL